MILKQAVNNKFTIKSDKRGMVYKHDNSKKGAGHKSKWVIRFHHW